MTKKNEFRKPLSPIIFFTLLALTTCILVNDVKAFAPSELHPANAIWMEPSSVTTASLGDKFNITVWANITQESYAWQIRLHFNSTYLNATRIGYTNDGKSDFFAEHSPMPMTPRINNEEGYVLHGETLLGTDERAPGCGSLMFAEFRLIKIPPPTSYFYLNFSTPYGIDTFLLTPYAETLPITTVEGTYVSARAITSISCSLSSISIARGQNVAISGAINVSISAPVTIQTSIGGTVWTNLTTVPTSASGAYSHLWTPLETGTYKVRATWSGDAIYLGSTSPETALVVTEPQPSSPDYTIYIIATAVSISAVIVSIFIYRRLRARVSKEAKKLE